MIFLKFDCLIDAIGLTKLHPYPSIRDDAITFITVLAYITYCKIQCFDFSYCLVEY